METCKERGKRKRDHKRSHFITIILNRLTTLDFLPVRLVKRPIGLFYFVIQPKCPHDFPAISEMTLKRPFSFPNSFPAILLVTPLHSLSRHLRESRHMENQHKQVS